MFAIYNVDCVSNGSVASVMVCIWEIWLRGVFKVFSSNIIGNQYRDIKEQQSVG